MNLSVSARALGLLAASAAAITIAEINGNKFKSPYSGMEVTGVTGVVTVRASDGFYLRSLASDNDNNPTTSESLFVGARKIANNIKPGVQVTLDGHVELLGCVARRRGSLGGMCLADYLIQEAPMIQRRICPPSDS